MRTVAWSVLTNRRPGHHTARPFLLFQQRCALLVQNFFAPATCPLANVLTVPPALAAGSVCIHKFQWQVRILHGVLDFADKSVGEIAVPIEEARLPRRARPFVLALATTRPHKQTVKFPRATPPQVYMLDIDSRLDRALLSVRQTAFCAHPPPPQQGSPTQR